MHLDHGRSFSLSPSTPHAPAVVQLRDGSTRTNACCICSSIWKAFQNQYWPAHYLIDHAGRIRYRHYGEGDYDRTEKAIRAVLALRS
ncbi:hypothetical protein [Ottowia sp.]|uniref:hypothetical protein n=1 Tax=Ottowia sp. TaxID=1898956 RepID=UPI003A898C34